MSSRLCTLSDTCDTCTVDNYIKAVHEGNPRALLVRGWASKRTLAEAVARLSQEFAEKSGNAEYKARNNALREAYMRRSRLACLAMAAWQAAAGDTEKAAKYLQGTYHVNTQGKDAAKLVKTINRLSKGEQIKLAEAERKLEQPKEAQARETTAREAFITNMTAFKMVLELSFNPTLDITLSEYIIYNKQYEAYIKRQQARKAKYGK